MQDQCAIITGGATGIGRHTAYMLADKGAKVVIADINEKEALETVRLIQSGGKEALFFNCNVSNPAAIKDLCVFAIEHFGPIKMAVNNAGIGGKMAALHETSHKDWKKVLEINLNGVFYCMQEEIKAMLHHGGGRIVNVSSLAGLGGVPGGSAYGASKHAVIGLTKSAALEYARFDIRVNAVCPGWTNTAILNNLNPETLQKSVARYVPMRRLGTPEEVAAAITWLLDEQSSFVTGHCLTIDGGMKAG